MSSGTLVQGGQLSKATVVRGDNCLGGQRSGGQMLTLVRGTYVIKPFLHPYHDYPNLHGPDDFYHHSVHDYHKL